MSLELDPVETRILGCLLEKERLTPEYYPLSLNSLTAACSQSTNREPVVAWDEATVERGLDSLRLRKLAVMLHAAGARAPKYRHALPDHFELSRSEMALLTVLLLRGPQTAGELRARTDRYQAFQNIEEVEQALIGMGTGGEPLVKLLPARPGQKERRYVQTLSAFQEEPQETVIAYTEVPAEPGRMEKLEAEVDSLRKELQALREEFQRFREQF